MTEYHEQQFAAALAEMEADFDEQMTGVLDDESSDKTIEVSARALFEVIQYLRGR